MAESHRQETLDLYELLEVSPRASQDVIQAAYRALARTYHPDLNLSAEAGFRIRRLNDAYQVLSDPPQRARYDLERTRARRHEWVVHPEQATTFAALSRPARGRSPAVQATVRRPIEDRFSLLNGQVMLGLIVVATAAALALILIWASLDSTVDTTPVYRAPSVEITGP